MPPENISPVGWYVASYLQRFEFEDEDTSDLERRCRAWENTILVQASTPEEAYKKTVAQAKLGQETGWTRGTSKGRLIFEGLTSLLPIYDELEDGAEILWKDFPNSKVKTIKSRVKAKADLGAFSKDDPA
jgi:hypothetical protein